MRKIATLFIVVLLTAAAAKAQYVNIPDTNFRTFLISKYPTCFNVAKQMDTTCSDIVNEKKMLFNYGSGISPESKVKSISGIKYFKSLKKISATNIPISSFDSLPNGLDTLICSSKCVDSATIILPSALTYFDCSGTAITKMPRLPNTIRTLLCSDIGTAIYPYLLSTLNSISRLPDSLKYFEYSNNHILHKLPSLPNTLQYLICQDDSLSSVPTLPNTLQHLFWACRVTNSFPTLPNSLKYLYCAGNYNFILPALPNSLKQLSCCFFDSIPTLPNSLDSFTYTEYLNNLPNIGGLKNLPTLPNSLTYLSCGNIHHLVSLPPLPNSLEYIECPADSLTQLPTLPTNLKYLNCGGNKLTSLPTLPPRLKHLGCSLNRLTSLPALPDSLNDLYCNGNFITCLPHLPISIALTIDFPNLIKCIPNKPNYIIAHTANGTAITNIPVCSPVSNANQCVGTAILSGVAFSDYNFNGKKDANEHFKSNFKINLSGNISSFTGNSGRFYFGVDSFGTYTITPQPNSLFNSLPLHSTHQISALNSLTEDTFALQPAVLKDSINISCNPITILRPGFNAIYFISYRNVGTTPLSNVNINLNYDTSILIYQNTSALASNSNNNLLANIGYLYPEQIGGFEVNFKVKSTASIGQKVISVASTIVGTTNSVDTSITYIRGSFDPNDKTATPELSTTEVAQGKQIDYTIHFQNTGTDTSFNIVVADTLDSKLNFSTMQMVATSHNCKTTIKDNIIFFEMRNIMLPDSNVNKLGSCGFVRFTMQPKSTVVAGDNIPNKAAIYFDYNAPVITNTANTIIQNTLPLTLLNFSAIIQQDLKQVLLYWNTANEINTLHFVIEQSVNGKDFAAVTEVSAIGIGSNSYYFAINKSNVVYLRLKIVDKNGTYTYSNIIKLVDNSTQGFDILINPVKNNLNLRIYSLSLNNSATTIINAQGQIVKTFVLKQGFQSIDIAGLQSGMYYLRTNIGVKKFVVEK